MGRSRKPESEKMISLTINLQKKILDIIEKDGVPKKIIEGMVNEKYRPKLSD